MLKFLAIALTLLAATVASVGGDGVRPPQGPTPRFVTVQRLDAEKGELIVSEECLPHPDVVSRTITKKEENRREEPVGTGSTLVFGVYYYTTTHKLPLKQVTLYEASGKKLPVKELARLKPGVMVLMSADGHPVEPEYLALVKPDTLILVVEVEALPSPFESHESTPGITRQLRQPPAAWGKPAAGLQAGIRVLPQAARPDVLGELEIVVRNVSAEAIEFSHRPSVLFWGESVAGVVSARGEHVYGGYQTRDMRFKARLAPGDEHPLGTMPVFPPGTKGTLLSKYTELPPGSYQVGADRVELWLSGARGIDLGTGYLDLRVPAVPEKPLPPTPKKLGRVPAPSPELRAELARLDDAYRGGTPERFAELEERAAALAKQYPAKDDQARIWAQVAWVAGQSGVDKHAGVVRKYATKCLEVSRDPLDRGRMYSLLASTVDLSGTAFPKGRREAAGILLTGYRELLAQELPEAAPELPVVETIGDVTGRGGAEEAQARARHAAQLAVREEAQFICDQIDRRDILVRQLRDLYKPDAKRHGRTPDGPEELRALAAAKLADKQVDVLMKRVTE